MANECGREGCNARILRLGEVNRVIYVKCENHHFSRLDLDADSVRGVEIGGCEVPGEISLTGLASAQD